MRICGKWARWIIIAAFVAMLLIGLIVFDDYGLSCDELIERQSAAVNYRYINRVLFDRDVFSDVWPTPLSEYRDRYYGVTMQLPMIAAEDAYMQLTGAPMESETAFLMRHLYTFLIYYFALVCFYRMLRRLIENPYLALLGVLTIYLFGQFFAHSFYNIKDLLFASLLMVTLSCMERVFATGRKPLWCALFAVSGTLLVTSRIVGAVLFVLVLLVMAWQDVSAARASACPQTAPGRKPRWWLPYLLICAALPLWVLVTPAAWSDPVGFALGYVRTFSNYQDPTGAAQAAEAVAAGAVIVKADTRFYFIRHILASVPVVTQMFALLGVGAYGVRAGKRMLHKGGEGESPAWGVMLTVFAGTLLYQAIAQPNVYDGWRHGFYLYPLLVAFFVYGLNRAIVFAQTPKRAWVRVAALGLVGVSLAGNAARIAVNHPHEYAMNNVFARNTEVAREGDYWRLIYYDLAEWVLHNEPGEARVCLTDPTGGKEWIIDQLVLRRLPDADATRLQFGYLAESDYVLQNYAYLADYDWPLEGFAEVYAIWMDGQKLGAVARRIG